MAQTSRWDMKNWEPGKVTFFQALGLNWNIKYPQLRASLASAAAANQKPAKNNPASSIGKPTGQSTQANQALGQKLAAVYGWGSGAQWTALNNVAMQESGWNNTAQNPTTSAYGIGQFLDSTWGTVGGTKTSDPTIQIKLMLKYIQQRYGTPEAAWAHEQAYNWY